MKKIQKTSRLVERILGFLFWFMLVISALGIVITGIELWMQANGKMGFSEWSFRFGSLSLGFAADVLPEKFQWFDATLLITSAIDMAFGLVSLRLLRNIFRPLAEGTPFSGAVSRNLRKMAFVELVWGVIGVAAEAAVQTLFFRDFDLSSLLLSEKITSCKLEFQGDLSFLVTFVILLLLSYVFRYGAELQQLSDETI